MTPSSGDPAMRATWGRVVDSVKQTVMSPTLWRALERVVPITQDGDVFVIGMATVDGQMAGQVNSQENRLAIENALRTLTGKSTMTLRVIDGTDLSDWEAAKRRDAVAATQRAQKMEQRQAVDSAFSSWDDIYDQVSRLWAGWEFRALTTGRARYIERSLDIVEKALPGLYPTYRTNLVDLSERGLSRVLERIANQAGSVDPILVATLLLQRLRAKEEAAASEDGGGQVKAA